MDTDEHRLNEITEKIIRCVYVVANTLGNGFLEKVYENALAHELRKSGFLVEQQKGIKVRYDGVVVGDYMVALLVQNEVLVELKAVKSLDNIHVAQCLNYLKATKFKVCLLLNFGTPRVQIRRLVH
ncbi:MAG: GxxExxY protein [Candidatus Entotheonellia bacterium]